MVFFAWFCLVIFILFYASHIQFYRDRVKTLELHIATTDHSKSDQGEAEMRKAEQLFKKAEDKMSSVIAKETELKEKSEEIKALERKLRAEKSDLERLASKTDGMKDEVESLKRAFHHSLEEVTNLWINDEWKLIRDRLSPDNMATQEAKLEKVFETCDKLGLEIDKRSQRAFFVQLQKAWEEEVELQKAKNEQNRIKELMREEARAEKARASELKRIEAETKELEQRRKENDERLTVLRELETLKKLTAEQQLELEQASAENESLLIELEEKERCKSMAELTRAGNVYVISNIGSFGEGVYKVGMTRRLIPEERVKELGDASVPFPFDIHMMIPTEDAPALETKLHEALWPSRLNLVNDGKEFFRTELPKIKKLIDDLGGKPTYQFFDHAKADQWRESELRRKAGSTGHYDVTHEVPDEQSEDAA